MKKTKIICSVGPACSSPDVFEQMVNLGADVARINFSHATLEEKVGVVAMVKEVRKRTGKNVGILYDTKGPEFRNGLMEDNSELVVGNEIRILKNEVKGNAQCFSVNHPQAIDALTIGSTILLENGLMSIVVKSIEEDGVTCTITSGGVLGSKKSLSVPGVDLNIPFISEIDEEDIRYACQHEGDFIACSFVSTADDVLAVRKILAEENRSDMLIIAKIESMTGINNIDEIINVSDGIMVARGDLGVEVPMTKLPIMQKMMARKCRENGKICVVATEMLESMKTGLRPTRAEVSDVANAVLDGTDAVMLSGETTMGKSPIATVNFMASICRDTEDYYDKKFDYTEKIGVTESIADAVCNIESVMNIKAIIAPTVSGYSAKKISNLKPKCPILATCTTAEVANKLALNYGVITKIVPVFNNTDDVLNNATEEAKKAFELQSNDKIIITGSLPLTSDKRVTNFMKIEEI